MLAVTFLASGLVVVLAGSVLARYGDAIGERTRIGGLWIGTVLLAAATSLPELATDITAVRIGAPNLAVGDLFGSSMANMLVLAVVDLLWPRKQILRQATFDHALSGSLAIALNALAAVFVLMGPGPSFLGIGVESSLLLVLYIAGTRAVYRHATRDRSRATAGESGTVRKGHEPPPLRRAIAGFLVAATAILVAAPFFARSAKAVAEVTGLGTTFVGTWIVGLSTSLPELATSIAAVRMGAFDLAVGNLFGSNGFNMAIFFALDLAKPGGAIFSGLDPLHAVSALFGVMLTSMGLAAIIYRAERRFAMIEPGSILIVVTYLLGIWLLYTRSGGS